MKLTAIAGLLSCAVIFTVASSSTVNAAPTNLLEDIQHTQQPLPEIMLASAESNKEPVQPVVPQVITHKVQSNESLSKIATTHQTTWKRLFDKNTQIENPNIITVGEQIVVPASSEVIPDRPVPVHVQQAGVSPVPIATQVATQKAKSAQTRQVAPASSAGNRYTAGYCTWYVKNRRPSLPNNLGNANTWVARAAAQGMATGSTPQVGAVGQRGMHVVYVEAVNSDGSVVISEMNHKGLYVKTVRTLPGNYFTYIY